MADWSPQQDAALKAVAAWLRDPSRKPVFRLFGYAGTGKTTLAREFAAGLPGRVMFGAFTGKAAHVMRSKGCEGARTLHSMIYRLGDETASGEPRFVLDYESDLAGASLLIVDECSMVGEDLGKDVLSFRVPVLVLGDPAQLPPVRGDGFFTSAKPDVMLTEVHRQAAGSPIISLATAVRERRDIVRGSYGDSRVIARTDLSGEAVLAADQVLVGLNKTRASYNRRIRELKGIDGFYPQAGEKLICLRNDRIKRLLNGSLWTVEKFHKRSLKDEADSTSRMLVIPDDAPAGSPSTRIRVRDEFWSGSEADLSWEERRGTDEFTFGYALTVHKSQGSQWNNVLVFDESSTFREDAWRWKYTAITRAANAVTVVQ